MTYYAYNSSTIQTDTGLFIPIDANNSDYQDYLAWVAAGNTIGSALPKPSGSDTLISFDNLDVGVSAIYDGTSGRILYNNAGILGEIATSGSGSVVLNQGASLTNASSATTTLTGTLTAGGGVGTNGQLLQSTGTGIQWSNISGSGSVVLATAPTISNLVLSGTLTAGGATGTSGQLLQTTGSGVQWLTPSYEAILTKSVATVTTSDVTGAINTLHYLDLSGLTANRYLNMPTPTAIGQRCVVYISTGSASYSLIPYNATGNVELARLFINGEYMSFIATDTSVSGWVAEIDGRKPCVARVTYSGTSQSFTSGSSTNVTLNSSVVDNASLVDTTNSRLKIRRTGKYALTGGLRLNNISAAIPRMILSIRQTDTAAILGIAEMGATSTTLFPAISVATIAEISEGKTIDLLGFQNSGSSQSTASSAGFPHLAMQEILT